MWIMRKEGRRTIKKIMMKHDQDQRKKKQGTADECETQGLHTRSESDGTSMGQWAMLMLC